MVTVSQSSVTTALMVRSVLAEQHGATVKLTFDHLYKNVIALELMRSWHSTAVASSETRPNQRVWKWDQWFQSCVPPTARPGPAQLWQNTVDPQYMINGSALAYITSSFYDPIETFVLKRVIMSVWTHKLRPATRLMRSWWSLPVTTKM